MTLIPNSGLNKSIRRAAINTNQQIMKVRLSISNGSTKPPNCSFDKENDYSQWQHYTIQPGDSLSVIAKRYAISVKQLKAFNNLKTDRIRAGKKLILPMLADQQVEHLVKSGESLWKIAKRYNVSITKLKQWNNLSRDRLQIGEKLTVFLSNS